jgi:hypothetical protein
MSKLTDWRLWFHYVLLVGVLFIAHHYSGFIEQMITEGAKFGWPLIFVWYFLWIGIGDQLIHWILRETTGWKD